MRGPRRDPRDQLAQGPGSGRYGSGTGGCDGQRGDSGEQEGEGAPGVRLLVM
ncbi:hypothetical protein [Streptomyces caelestis]|uniref:hypothetical protein n=1 Tax=Streptomyces caelestis TaxID=36816 RepID=UPI0036FE6165